MSTTNPTDWTSIDADATEYVLESIKAGDKNVVALDFLFWAERTNLVSDEFTRMRILRALEGATGNASVPCSHCNGSDEWHRDYDGHEYSAPCGDCHGKGGFQIDGAVVWSHEELEAMAANDGAPDYDVAAE